MKKVLIILLFIIPYNTFAVPNTIINPDFSYIASVNPNNWLSNEPIEWGLTSAVQFCDDYWQQYISHITESNNAENHAMYDWSAWQWQWTATSISEITCEDWNWASSWTWTTWWNTTIEWYPDERQLAFYQLLMICIWLFIVYQWQCFWYSVNTKMYNSMMKYFS